jgi:hypothetical protein
MTMFNSDFDLYLDVVDEPTEADMAAYDADEALVMEQEAAWHAANQPQFTDEELDAMIAWDEATREGL